MMLALEELRKSLAYHQRQIEDNLREITRKEEAIRMYNERNIRHEQTAAELNLVITQIEGGEQE